MNPKANILIAEDDANFGLVLKSYLSVNHYEVTLCPDGQQAYQAFLAGHYHLCILDVMMPQQDGFSLAEQIRQTGRNVPFVFLTAKALKEDQVRGYRLGAIDYLIKPFDPEILLLKIEAILSRSSSPQRGTAPHLQIGSFAFHSEKRLLQQGDQERRLSPKENELLRLLAERQGEVLTREEALVKIWQEDNYFTAQSMNVYLTKLRKYLREDPKYRVEIENLHGKGFVLRIHPAE